MEKFFHGLENFLKTRLSRRGFLALLATGLLAVIANSRFLKFAFAKSQDSPGRKKKNIRLDYDLVAVEGDDPYQNTVKAVGALGGMRRLVKPGDVVVIKPNMAWDRTPEQAANTNPQVVAALVEMAYRAGAKRVNVFDIPCNEDRRVYERSGIAEAARKKGAHVYFANHWDVVKAQFPYPSGMKDWPILRDAVDCDVFINVPVIKHHSLAGQTLSMKNLMGVCSGVRALIHVDIGNKLVDLTDFISPELTVIDATRVLTKHGPSGGNLEDVITLNKVFASTDPTLADSFACRLRGIDPMRIANLRAAEARGFGNSDVSGARILEVKI